VIGLDDLQAQITLWRTEIQIAPITRHPRLGPYRETLGDRERQPGTQSLAAAGEPAQTYNCLLPHFACWGEDEVVR
jgi:hypothetical protein